MENDLNFNSDEILDFLTNIEMDKENIRDIMEFVHYKSSLNTIKYMIEFLEENPDTSGLVVNYVQIVKKVEDIIKKISENYGQKKNDEIGK